MRGWISQIIETEPGSLITLGGLTADEFVELFDAEHGPSLHAETGGNPMLAGELWRAGVSSRDVAVPPTIGMLIGARIDRLRPAAARFVDDAAVAGLSFDPVVVATATGLDVTALGDALDQLTSAGLIEMSALAVARFVHPLMQRAVLARLSPVNHSTPTVACGSHTGSWVSAPTPRRPPMPWHRRPTQALSDAVAADARGW